MSPELTEALRHLCAILQEECNPHTVAVALFIDAEGYEIKYKTRSPESLKRAGISMRNITGDYIRE